MSKKKLLALLTASALTVGLLSGCGGGGGTTESPSGGGETTPVNTETEPGAASGGDIYVLVPNADHGWTGAVLNYAQEKAEEVNAEGSYNVVVQAATDAKNQQEQIDDLLAAATPPAGIVILPYDNTMESSMASIAATDIPFIMVDRIIDNPVVQEKVTANVKGDNEGIGKATAERFIADGLQPGDKLYVMIGDTSSVPEMRNKPLALLGLQVQPERVLRIRHRSHRKKAHGGLPEGKAQQKRRLNAHSAEIHRDAPGEFQHHVHRLQAAWIRPRMGEAYKLLLHADLSHTVAELAQHHLQAVLGNFHAHWPELFPNERKKLAPADTPRPAQDLQNVLLLNR